MVRITIYLALITLIPIKVSARPVSYPGGWTAMQMNNGDWNSFHLHYSPTAKYSLGYRGEYWRDQKYWLHSLAINNLLKRWNGADSQANLYLKSGAGIAYSDHDSFDNETDPLLYTGVATDWENRRFFAMYEGRGIYAGDIDQSFHQNARVGIAPYVGEYGDLHTWLMLQADHDPGSEDNFSLTPLVRLFKGEYLLEAGVSDQGKALLNCVIRF